MSYRSMLIDTCTVSRPVRTPDGSGTQTLTWTVVYTNKPCYSEHSNNLLWTANGRVGSIAKHTLFVELGQEMQTGWKVVIDNDTSSYLISYVDPFHHHHIECEMQVIDSPQGGTN